MPYFGAGSHDEKPARAPARALPPGVSTPILRLQPPRDAACVFGRVIAGQLQAGIHDLAEMAAAHVRHARPLGIAQLVVCLHGSHADGIDLDVGWVLAEPVASSGVLRMVELPACLAVTAFHSGGVNDAPATVDALAAWARHHGHATRQPAWLLLAPEADIASTPGLATGYLEVIVPLLA